MRETIFQVVQRSFTNKSTSEASVERNYLSSGSKIVYKQINELEKFKADLKKQKIKEDEE